MFSQRASDGMSLVPEFIIKRLLKRDAGEMIARPRGEIATRGQQLPAGL